MVVPTRSLLGDVKPDGLPPLATKLTEWSQFTASDAINTKATITGLDWSGRAKDAADDRATREHTQLMRVADALADLASTVTKGHDDLTRLKSSLETNAAGFEEHKYQVSENWTVTDTYNYEAARKQADGDDDALSELRQLEAARKNEALTGTTMLQRAAQDFHDADTTTAAAIRTANGEIGRLAPVTAGLGPALVGDMGGGRLTPEQLQALRAATQLTPEQLDALNRGLPVQIPQGQYDYLMALGEELKGMSITDISQIGQGEDLIALGEELKGMGITDISQIGQGNSRDADLVQYLLANGLQLIGNPQVQTTTGDVGGMDKLPSSVQTLLTEDLTPEGFESEVGIVTVPRLADLIKFQEMISKGDADLRIGSDVNRGVVKQVSELTEMNWINPPEGVTLRSSDVTLTKDETRELLDGLLEVAADDTTAVTDFLTGRNMDVTYTDGSTFDAERHLKGILGFHWGSERNGVDGLFEWQAPNAGNPDNPFLAKNAADSAYVVGSFFGGGENFDFADTLANSSPHLYETMARAQAPFLAGLHGTEVPDNLDTGVASLDPLHMANMYQAFSGSAETAGIMDRAVWEWQNHLTHLAMQDPDSEESTELVKRIGAMGEIWSHGNNQYTERLDEQRWESVEDYLNEVSTMSTLQGALGVLGGIPYVGGVPAAGTSFLFPDVPELNLPESGATLDDTSPTGSATSLQWAMVIGMLEADPILAQRYQEFYNDEGVLDFETAQESNEWMRMTESEEFADFERQFGRGEKDALRLPHPMDPPDMGSDTRPSGIGQDEGEGHR